MLSAFVFLGGRPSCGPCRIRRRERQEAPIPRKDPIIMEPTATAEAQSA